jgi:hypothetical protein
MMRPHKLTVMYGVIIETTYKVFDTLRSPSSYCQKRQSKRRQKSGVKLLRLSSCNVSQPTIVERLCRIYSPFDDFYEQCSKDYGVVYNGNVWHAHLKICLGNSTMVKR